MTLRDEIERLERIRSNWDRELRRLRELIATPGPRGARDAMDAVSTMYSEIVIASGSKIARELEVLRPLAEDSVREVEARTAAKRELSWTVLRTADLDNAVQSVGLPFDTALLPVVAGWLPRIKVSRDDPDTVARHWALGFAALGLDVDLVYRGIAGIDRGAPIPFSPGEQFELNIQGFLRHLAGAVAARAQLDDVRPAWTSLLLSYPYLRDAGSLDAAGLLWAARIVHHRIGGGDLGGTADFLHDSIWKTAQLS